MKIPDQQLALFEERLQAIGLGRRDFLKAGAAVGEDPVSVQFHTAPSPAPPGSLPPPAGQRPRRPTRDR